MAMELLGAFPDVPVAALPTIAAEVRKYGARVVFESGSSSRAAGYVESVSGKVRFQHDGRVLLVFLEIDRDHFPRLMLKGGTRQIVMESVELWKIRST